ncbi:hypothetical protein [Pseudomonas proteolytica]|uniref:hypothetical protein n=1 Tax=Pseudomonas proteolytica TaxID=219574 RepID=UPI001472A99A|nr:hypothetical protein [Pseudomonas proteolytica]NMZ35403.1 hypothetical protein [Pseudomonas proteolytica]
MAVAVVPLVGSDIPENMRGTGVEAVWEVQSNGGLLKRFYSKDEAFGFAAHVEKLEAERKPTFSKGPSM